MAVLHYIYLDGPAVDIETDDVQCFYRGGIHHHYVEVVARLKIYIK